MFFRLWKQVGTAHKDSDPIREVACDAKRIDHNSGYHNISIGGDARVIVGNAYGIDNAFIRPTQSQPGTTGSVLAQYENEDQGQNTAETEDAALPVLVLHEYGQIDQRIKFHRHSSIAQFRKWAKSIDIWHTIFQQSLQDLLEPFEGSAITHQMLSDNDHIMWSSDALKSHLEARFSFHVHTIERTLAAISSNLRFVDEVLLRLQGRPITESQYNARSDSDSSFLDRVLLRLFKETNHFRTLILHSASRREKLVVSDSNVQARTMVKHYSRIQTAAENLYRSLGLACSKHMQHQVHLMLHAITKNPSQVSFKLLLAQSHTKVTRSCRPLLRLCVESQFTSMTTMAHTGVTENASCCPSFAKRKKRPLGSEIDQSTIMDNDSYQDDHESRNQSYDGRNTAESSCRNIITGAQKARKLKTSASIFAKGGFQVSPKEQQNSDPLPNFCSKGDFCAHMSSVQSRRTANERALGYLASRECTKHLIYLDDRGEKMRSASNPFSRTDPITLKEFLATAELSQSKIVSISKQLAVAAIQYHATPWLEVWDNDHVLVTDLSTLPNSLSPETSTFESYVDVLIHKPGDLPSAPISSRSKTLIPNWTLLKLGILLLELAYQKPLREMQEPDDLYPNEHDTDFFTARRLSLNVSRKMGTRYAKVVERCVSCNFGHGEDLSNTNLQACYYENVIQELEEIEAGLKKLGL